MPKTTTVNRSELTRPIVCECYEHTLELLVLPGDTLLDLSERQFIALDGATGELIQVNGWNYEIFESVDY